ncbi:MAG TPA: MipA/OmpV family protein [Steroidobacteraceae bacterium]|jgi:outer membrane scaffolding protein for murein synthesis (MipA/OmpV family)|nr:MipA/OmpV family protein [Steroidobacteraceae bacterium]
MVGAPLAGRRSSSRVAALLVLAWAAAAEAKEEPLLEIGMGVGAIAFEDYRGSNTTHAYPLPIPYLLYNGKFLKADREGVRGTLFNQDWVELNLSGNATTPVRNDRERSGMPDLRSTLELGPSLDFHLLRSADSRIKFDLRLPLRAAFTVEASPKFIGWTFTPRLALDVGDPFGYAGWNAGILVGPLFADHRYHDYFYTVAPQYATASRPAYEATGGYAGAQLITALSKRFPRYWVGAYLRADTLAGAAFTESPLVQRNSYWSAGFGISWMIHTSAQMVEVSR